jgi:RNA polymerase sigma-70 factor, ECF subfamily
MDLGTRGVVRRPVPRPGKGGLAGAPVHSGLAERLERQVRLAEPGDRAAVEELLLVVRPLLVRYCRAWVGRVDGVFSVADEVARGVCLAVFGGLVRGHGRESFLAFVFGLAAEARRGHPVSGEVALSAEQREILVLRVMVGFSAEETADALGMTPGAVRVGQHRALSELRRAGSAPEKV